MNEEIKPLNILDRMNVTHTGSWGILLDRELKMNDIDIDNRFIDNIIDKKLGKEKIIEQEKPEEDVELHK